MDAPAPAAGVDKKAAQAAAKAANDQAKADKKTADAAAKEEARKAAQKSDSRRPGGL